LFEDLGGFLDEFEIIRFAVSKESFGWKWIVLETPGGARGVFN